MLTTLLSKKTLTKFEKYLSLFIYYILPVIILITLITATISTDNMGFARQEIRANRGRALLIMILFIKPIVFLSKKYLKAEIITINNFLLTLKELPKTIKNNKNNIKQDIFKKHIVPFIINSIYSISLYLMRLRRPLGVATFWLLFTHGLLWQIFRIRQGFSLGFNIGQIVILSGMISLLALAIGAITSNDYAIKKLKNNRQKIQMVAYIAFFFGAIHTGSTGLLIIYFILKYFERRDTGTLKIRTNWITTQISTIKNNQWIKIQLNKIKNNKRIAKNIEKILKKFAKN